MPDQLLSVFSSFVFLVIDDQKHKFSVRLYLKRKSLAIIHPKIYHLDIRSIVSTDAKPLQSSNFRSWLSCRNKSDRRPFLARFWSAPRQLRPSSIPLGSWPKFATPQIFGRSRHICSWGDRHRDLHSRLCISLSEGLAWHWFRHRLPSRDAHPLGWSTPPAHLEP